LPSNLPIAFPFLFKRGTSASASGPQRVLEQTFQNGAKKN